MLPLSKARKTEPDGRRAGHPVPVAGLLRGVDAGHPAGWTTSRFVGSGKVDGQECAPSRAGAAGWLRSTPSMMAVVVVEDFRVPADRSLPSSSAQDCPGGWTATGYRPVSGRGSVLRWLASERRPPSVRGAESVR
ncbi:MAG: hypothetical protein JWR28_923 [Modestobacter sp.]|jgi:hypothetical protein|nr:hypothetical protein [Modestobacter sp.]